MDGRRFRMLLVGVVAPVAALPVAAVADAAGGPGARAVAVFAQPFPDVGPPACTRGTVVVEATRAPGASTVDVHVRFGAGDFCEELIVIAAEGTATLPAGAFHVAPDLRSATLSATVPLCDIEHVVDPCQPIGSFTVEVMWTATGHTARAFGASCRPASATGRIDYVWPGSLTLEPADSASLCRVTGASARGAAAP